MGDVLKKPKSIFIDCTATYYTGLNTGIQRVVRNIIARLDNIEQLYGIKCTPVILRRLIYSYLMIKIFLILYKNATAVIVASSIEGFGLPLVEAMFYNVPVIASDIEVFREIGGIYPTYFSLSNIDSLIDAVNQAKPKIAKNQAIKPTSWDDSANQLINKTLILYNDLKNKNGGI